MHFAAYDEAAEENVDDADLSDDEGIGLTVFVLMSICLARSIL